MRSLGPAAIGGVAAVLWLIGCGGADRRDAPAPRTTRVEPGLLATVPATFDHNRMIVEVEIADLSGGVRRAAAWIDTGNQYLIVGDVLAGELGLDRSGLETVPPGRSADSASPAPSVRIGGVALDMSGVGVQIRSGIRPFPGIPAEVNLPASALRKLHVVLDGPEEELTVAAPGLLVSRGAPLPCRLDPETGLLLVEASVDGEAVPLGVDNGSAGTWVSTRLTESWLEQHPDWRSSLAAVGSANFFGFPFETDGVLIRVPEIGIGGVVVRDVAALGLDQGLFDWYSQKSAGPVVGFLGGNILRRCRLEIDYPNRMTYWELGPEPAEADLDIVGLTLRPEADGGFTVAAVATREGVAAVNGVGAGDRLVEVDGIGLASATMGEAVAALRGRPGDRRRLVLDRAGSRVEVDAEVLRLP